MSLRFHLFGSPRVDVAGTSHALPSERRGQLVAFLAMKQAWVGRPELAALFWPDQSSKLAFANLRKTLFRLQGVAWADGLEVEGSAVRMVATTDVADFEAALRDGRVADALPLYTGDALRGLDDGQSEAWTGWLHFERERLRTAWRSAALDYLQGEIEPAAGVDVSARLLDADPLDEAALRAHMVWLSRHGHGARARQMKDRGGVVVDDEQIRSAWPGTVALEAHQPTCSLIHARHAALLASPRRQHPVARERSWP